MTKLISSIVGVLTLFGILFGVYSFMDSRYAKSQDLVQTNQRLDYKIKADQMQSIQTRQWQIEDRYQGKVMPDTVKEEYRTLDQQKQGVGAQLKVLEKKP